MEKNTKNINAENIRNRDILLMCQDFYGYDVVIKEALLKLGASNVYLVNSCFFSGSFRDLISWRTPFLYLKEPYGRSKWTNNLITKIDKYHIDILLCIELTPFKKYFIDYLRKKNPQIKTFLFLWDSLELMQSRYKDYFRKFDFVFSFDKDDCERYGLEYWPDFFIPNNRVCSEIKYDLCFIGTMNMSTTLYRAEVLKKISQFCDANDLRHFLYLKYYPLNASDNLFLNIVKKYRGRKYKMAVEHYKKESYMHVDSLPLDEVNKIIHSSRVVVDLSHQNRQGMTINCITALATGKKLITTNWRIMEEPFYNPNNILIINEDNPQIDISFFHTETVPVDMSYLRLDNWLKHIINR